jgi:C_GCAxxG_C_C family probable redox protein
MDRVEEAVQKFEKGFSCSQAIFSTYAVRFDLNEETALKIATSFGGGMGCMAKTCGAVTGAFMVLGLAFGRRSIEDAAAKDKTYELVVTFADAFKKKHDTILCRDLLGHDISTPEGMKQANEAKVVEERCPGFVRDAAEILENILEKG